MTVEAQSQESKNTKPASKRTTKKTMSVYDIQREQTERHNQELTGTTPEQLAERKKNLRKWERQIEQAQSSFFTLVDALHQIDHFGLYKPDHKTMGEYAEVRWDIDGPTLSRYLSAYKIMDALRAAGFSVLPTNEGQCRAFGTVRGKGKTKEERDAHEAELLAVIVEKWRKLVADNLGKRITAAMIEKAMGNAQTNDDPTNNTAWLLSLARKLGIEHFSTLVADCTNEDAQALEKLTGCKFELLRGPAYSFVFDELKQTPDQILSALASWVKDSTTVKGMTFSYSRIQETAAGEFPKK
jgi:hypothetical protein